MTTMITSMYYNYDNDNDKEKMQESTAKIYPNTPIT